jgi:hypothetical protein
MKRLLPAALRPATVAKEATAAARTIAVERRRAMLNLWNDLKPERAKVGILPRP